VTIPPATPSPCSDCPWRTNALAGWLGPYDVYKWGVIAASDEPIACHQTIEEDENWDTPGIRQCAGAASYRQHICKMPRDREVAVGPPNPKVFGSAQAFVDHHRSNP
jgi:hypothetical protein